MNKGLIILSIFIGFLGCTRSEDPSSPNQDFLLEAPWNLGTEVPYVERNPPSEKKIELGRMLFYDPILSGNNEISCSSCHLQSKAFSDGFALSTNGVSGNALLRHSPSLINLAWMPGLFWDGGARDIESLAFGPITHPDEMAQDLRELEEELNSHDSYPRLFKEAFGINDISRTEIARALAQFQRTLISADSKYDQWKRGENGVTLNQLELDGLELYKRKCISCHSTDLFTDNSYHNNGIDEENLDKSHEFIFLGRFRISYDSSDMGAFKTPTLRNIMLTAPYMHDGRFPNIDQVLDHYSSGIKDNPFLDQLLKENGVAKKMDFTTTEREALKAFLNSLTDQKFTTDPNLADPFSE